MSGVLQFSLGLTAGGFASAIAGANSKLKAFVGTALSMPGVGVAVGGLIGSFASLHAVVEGVMGAIEKGAALEDLSKRTGVAVGELYSLQKGFAAAGLEAGDVSGALFMMQKSLAGVNEQGESTTDIFSQLGLDIGRMKNLSGPQQLQTIMERINKLDQGGAVNAASKIFGRGQAGNMVQLARSSKDFAEAIKSSAEQAAIFQRSSPAFEAVDKSLAKLRGKANGLFAGIAEGAAPALQEMIDTLNKVDLTGIGVQLGQILTAFTQAWREGKLAMMIADTFKMGFDAVVLMAPAALGKLGIILLRVFEQPLLIIQVMMEKAIQEFMAYYAKIPGVAQMLGLDGFKAQSTEEIARDRAESGVEFWSQGNNLDTMNEDMNSFWDQQVATLKEKWGAYDSVVQGFVARAPKPKGSEAAGTGKGGKSSGPFEPEPKGSEAAGTGKGGKSSGPFEPEAVKPEFTQFEKMGFVMSGLNNPALDYARTTASGITRLVQLAERPTPPAGSPGGNTIDNT
jgi:archaellum component FlaC